MLESEVGEGGFLVNIVVGVNDQAFCFGHVGWFVAAGRVYFADEGFAGSGSLVKCDVPDAALPFAPTFGGDILLNIVVGVPRFGDDGARNRVVVEADGCVGACCGWRASQLQAASMLNQRGSRPVLLTGHRGPGDDSPFGVLSQVDDMRDRAVIDTVTGDTRIFGMMHESRVGVVDGGASVDEMSGKSRIDVVASGGGVDYMLGDASVGKVRGRASMMRDRSHVDYVMDGGFVEEVHDDASVDSVTFRGRVKGVYEGGRVALVDAGGVVEHVSGSARVGSVDSGGRVNKVDGKGAAVMNVGSGGRVGAVTGGGVVVDVGVSDATEPCVVESVGSSSKVSLLDCWADVTYECGESNVSAARAREFVVKRLSDDATGIGGECLARANGDNPFERSNVRLRVRDAEGRVVDVPDVDGVLSALTEVDDDERELMWESMMGSPNSK